MGVQYRLANRNSASPRESLEDCYGAYFWVREHSESYRIDEDKIFLVGGGVHMAFWGAGRSILFKKKPCGVALFNPVLNTTETGFGADLLMNDSFDFSPLHHVSANYPPCLLVHSEKDQITTLEESNAFFMQMKLHNNPIEYVILIDANHGNIIGRERKNKPQSLPFFEYWLFCQLPFFQ